MARERREGGRDRRQQEQEPSEFEEQPIKIARTAAVVKGGRRFSFNALVAVGNRKGKVGLGWGKANEVPSAIEKGVKDGKRRLTVIQMKGRTVPHEVIGKYRTACVKLVPASPGTGIIAGASARAVIELVGIRDVLTKVYGSTNPLNVAKATLDALSKLRTRADVERLRGVKIDELDALDAKYFVEHETRAVTPQGAMRERTERGGDRRRGAGGPGGGVDVAAPGARKEVAIPTADAAAADAKPAEADAKPAEADAKPAEADAKPAEADVKPAEADVKPAEADVKPAEADVKPEGGADASKESKDENAS